MDTYPIGFRDEVLQPFFDHVRAGDSFCVVGAPSVGKTRLMDFLMGDDPDAARLGMPLDRERVKKHYLGADAAARTWLARVDMNNMRFDQGWGFHFYELLLHTLLLTSSRIEQTDDINEIKNHLAHLDSQVIESKDPLKAHRFLGMAIHKLCHSDGIRICFLFDEFDETYKSMPRDVFAQLRGIRDANKYMVSYALFMRNLPKKLLDPEKNEPFYELLRYTHGIGPYSRNDTLYIINQLENRHGHQFLPEQHDLICSYSGGHPGFIQALFAIFKDQAANAKDIRNVDWLVQQDSIQEESRKIWIGLLDDEQEGLLAFAQGKLNAIPDETRSLLLTKGLLVRSPVGNTIKVFSPLFAHWLAQK